jgi:membrane protein required for colicin V production
VVLDIIFIALLLYAVVSGIRRGVVVQIAQLLSVLLGIYGAYKFSHLTAVLLRDWGFNAPNGGTAAFFCTFIIVVIAVVLLGKVVHRLVQAVMMGWLNRLMGAIFAVGKVLFLTSVALVIIEGLDFLPQKQVNESKMYAPVAAFAPAVCKYLDINELKNAASSIDKKIDEKIDEKVDEKIIL